MKSTTKMTSYVLAALFCLLLLTTPAFVQGDSWETKTPMPTARFSPVAGAINGILYVAGGNNGRDTAVSEAYNPATDAWTSLPPPPHLDSGDDGRYGGAAAVIDGKLYVIGGWRTSPPLPTSTLLVYDAATNSWSTRASLPRLSACSAAGVIDGKLYVLTACNGFSGYFSFLDVFDPLTNSWTTKASAPHAHADPGGGVINGKFYVVGGLDASGVATGTLDVYDPQTDTWATKAPMPTPRSVLAGGVINGQLYAVGGANAGGQLNTVEAYDPLADTWATKSPMPSPRQSLAGAVIDGKLYAVGGYTSSGATGTLEVYIPTTQIVPPVTYTFTKIADNTGPIAGFDAPSINDNGALAFVVGLRAGGSGIFTGNGGALTKIADPGTSVGSLGEIPTSETFSGGASINAAGTVAFRSLVIGPGGSLTGGIFTGDGGPIHVVVLNPTDRLLPHGFRNPIIDNAGRVWMAGAVTPDISAADSIFVANNGQLDLVYDRTKLASLGFPGLGTLYGFSVNQVGTLAFVAGGVFPTNVIKGNGGPLTNIVTFPGPLGESSPLDGRLSVSNSGVVAFRTGINLGVQGIFTGGGGPVNTIVTVTTASSPFGFVRVPSLNDSGTVIFTAQLQVGEGGIFSGPDPVADKVIAPGDALFGSTVRFAISGRFALNDAGQIAFVAGLANGTQVVVRADPVSLNRPPLAACHNVTVRAGPDCRASASIDNGSFDPDGDPITLTQSPPGPYPLGTTSVMLTVADSKGASNSCAATVTVVDGTPPTINCPGDIITETAPGACSAVVNFNITASDNCSGASVVSTPPSGSVFSKGTTIVASTATDASGNTSTCSFTVTVVDREPPGITCPASFSVTANLGSSSAAVSYPAPTASDNCGLASVACSPPSGSSFPVGATTVSCTATDSSGNTASCAFTVTVLTTQQATQSLTNNINILVSQGVLNQGEGNALTSKLQAAIQQMDKGNGNAARNQLQAFINQVNALMNSGSLSASQGQALIDAAHNLIAHIP